jgi:hypothetical protein
MDQPLSVASPTVRVPGSVGGMHPAESAEEMRTAYDSVVGGQWRQVVSPVLAPTPCGDPRHDVPRQVWGLLARVRPSRAPGG